MREFNIAEAAGRDQVPVPDGRRVDVVVRVRVIGHLRAQVREAIARVTPAAQQADSRNRDRRAADGR